jgi:hypothetical protein
MRILIFLHWKAHALKLKVSLCAHPKNVYANLKYLLKPFPKGRVVRSL